MKYVIFGSSFSGKVFFLIINSSIILPSVKLLGAIQIIESENIFLFQYHNQYLEKALLDAEKFEGFIIEPKQALARSSEEGKLELTESEQNNSTHQGIDFLTLQSDYG